MDRVKLATQAFQSGFNCTQAVLSAFCEDLELESGTATRLAECFGGTVCNAGLPCGALLGGMMVVGLYAGRAEPGDMEAKLRAQNLRARLTDAFEAQFGAADCRTLLKCDITTPEGMLEARASGTMLRCGEYVAFTASCVDGLLKEDN